MGPPRVGLTVSRLFVRSFLVQRRAQVTVVKDTQTRAFEIWLWQSRAKEIKRLWILTYQEGLAQETQLEAVAAARGIVWDLKRDDRGRIVEVLT